MRLPHQAMSLKRNEWETLYELLYLRRRFPHAQHDSEAEVITLLIALAENGDTADLPFLCAWVDTTAFLWANETGRVLEAVQLCLPVLLGRLQRETVGTTLLRPATAEASPDSLLRPAHSVESVER